MNLPADLDIAIVAPFPTKERVKEGWMSRINAVDVIVRDKRRLYISFAKHHARGRDDKLTQIEDFGWEICLSPFDCEHQKIVSEIVDAARIVYTHTIHLAEYIQPWLRSRKIVVDFHGIVPEEEAMLGRPELSPKYEKIEQEVLRNARACVMVTRSMENHYRNKYPEISPRTIILPIVESLPLIELPAQRDHRTELPVRAVYAGGTQVWQNINGMLDLACSTEHFASFSFLSHDWKLIEDVARKMNAPTKTLFNFCAKSDLGSEYQKYDFGLVLRDDTPVNRVACPTKLYEYMSIGLIPIVRTPALGDFLDLNYAYITEDEFREGFFPDSLSRRMMVQKNLAAVHSMRRIFSDGSRLLYELAD